jgi:hypothetical protein
MIQSLLSFVLVLGILTQGPVRIGTIVVKNTSTTSVLVEVLEGEATRGVTLKDAYCLVPGESKSRDTFSGRVGMNDLRFQIKAHFKQHCKGNFVLKSAQTPLVATAQVHYTWKPNPPSVIVNQEHEIILEGHDKNTFAIRVVTTTKSKK